MGAHVWRIWKCMTGRYMTLLFWLQLTDNMKRDTLRLEQIINWGDTLWWVVSVMPSEYQYHRDIIQSELELRARG